MKRLSFLALTLSMLSIANAQIIYESGYFIDNNRNKTTCLIKNIDWKNNPDKFEYKISENDISKTATIENISEFAIGNAAKYVRAEVQIDRSSEALINISTEKKPIFNTEQLFLKVILEGEASLYYYEDGSLVRFFFKVGETDSITQLVYKSYKTRDGKIGENYMFRSQLYTNMQCSNIRLSEFTKISYAKNELLELFITYNKCSNPNFTYSKQARKTEFNLYLRPGGNYSNLSINVPNIYKTVMVFDSKLNFRIGAEIEAVMPFLNNKWSVIFEPTYQYYKAHSESRYDNADITYNSIELPIGLRYYFFLTKDNTIFINTSIVEDVEGSKPKIDMDWYTDMNIKAPQNLAIGVGYQFKNKLVAEFRYFSNRELLATYQYWTSKYSTLSFIVGYKLF